MATSATVPEPVRFGPFDVTTQVFYTTPRSFALVNLKPLLPGHVLVCPRHPHRRLTDLDAAELADLFGAVQVVQRMLAAHYWGETGMSTTLAATRGDSPDQTPGGSFNLAIQDGPEAGQTVPHLHVHVIPQIRGTTAKNAATDGDALYDQMAAEPGNIGGAQWDAARTAREKRKAPEAQDAQGRDQFGPRPRPGGQFPHIEDGLRRPRSMAEMEAEASMFRDLIARIGA